MMDLSSFVEGADVANGRILVLVGESSSTHSAIEEVQRATGAFIYNCWSLRRFWDWEANGPFCRHQVRDLLGSWESAGQGRPWETLGDGVRRLLSMWGWLDIQSGNAVLLEDVGAGVHPRLFEGLVSQLQTYVQERDKRLVVTTLQPYLVDCFEARQIIVCHKRCGQVKGCPLSLHPNWPWFEGEISTGEFWLQAGESWVREAVKRGCS